MPEDSNENNFLDLRFLYTEAENLTFLLFFFFLKHCAVETKYTIQTKTSSVSKHVATSSLTVPFGEEPSECDSGTAGKAAFQRRYEC